VNPAHDPKQEDSRCWLIQSGGGQGCAGGRVRITERDGAEVGPPKACARASSHLVDVNKLKEWKCRLYNSLSREPWRTSGLVGRGPSSARPTHGGTGFLPARSRKPGTAGETFCSTIR